MTTRLLHTVDYTKDTTAAHDCCTRLLHTVDYTVDCTKDTKLEMSKRLLGKLQASLAKVAWIQSFMFM